MQREKRPVLFILLFAGCVLFIFLLMQPAEVKLGWGKIAILFPTGKIAREQRDLLLIVQALMLLWNDCLIEFSRRFSMLERSSVEADEANDKRVVFW